MKKSVLVLSVLSLVMSLAAQAAPATRYKMIQCNSPLAGFQANINGKIALKQVQSGAYLAQGNLYVQTGPVGQYCNPPVKVLFKGQYDRVNGFDYVTLGAAEESEIDMIYVSFNDRPGKVDSYVEFKGGARQPLDCSRSK